MLTIGGTIVNQAPAPHSYRIGVNFVNGNGQPVASGTTDVVGVAPNETRSWSFQAQYGGNLRGEGGSCRVAGVQLIG